MISSCAVWPTSLAVRTRLNPGFDCQATSRRWLPSIARSAWSSSTWSSAPGFCSGFTRVRRPRSKRIVWCGSASLGRSSLSGAVLPMRIAYLWNQYPKLSHTFIRREILALEEMGVEIVRIAIRGHETESLDSGDAEELGKTRYILKASLAEIITSLVGTLSRGPLLFLGALVFALRLGRRCDGGVLKHIAYFLE